MCLCVCDALMHHTANQDVAYPDTVNFKVNASSASPTARLIYSLAGAPAGAAISTDGTFTWTPTASLTTQVSSIAAYSTQSLYSPPAQVMVTVADAASAYVSDSKVFTLTATGVPTDTTAAPATTPPASPTSSSTTTATNMPIPTVGSSIGKVATPTPKAAVSTLSGTTGAAAVAATTTGAGA